MFIERTSDGSPAAVRSINKVGMERHGFQSDDIEEVRGIFKTLYKSNLNRSQAIDQLKNSNNLASISLTGEIIEFISNSERGLA